MWQTCLKKSGPSLSGFSKHFSNSLRKKLKTQKCCNFCFFEVKMQSQLESVNLLFMPNIDVMDVAKDYFVFPLHVIRDALLLHHAHVAL